MPIQLNQYFLYVRIWLLKFLASLDQEKNKNEVFACFFEKNLLILKSAPKAASNFCSGFPLLSLVDFFQCTFIAGFRTNFLDHRRVSESRNKLSEEGCCRNFTISKWFHRSKQKLNFGFPSQKTENCENHKRSFKKNCFEF